MPLPVEFQQGRLGRPPEDGRDQPDCLSQGAPLLSPLPATATATVGTESEGACITPDDLYRFLDSSSSSSTSSTSSNLFTSSSSTGSTSLPYTTPSTALALGPSFTAFDGANNAFRLDALFSSSVKEQPSTAFAAPAKAFDAGDILLPFDLAPSSTSISAADLLAFPVFDTASTSSLPPPLSLSADPLSLDATLDSPLGLTGSGYGSSTTSPLSEFLASPMFSLPGSAMASTTFSELPLPSPPGDAASATTALPFFPPLPSLPPSLDFKSTASTAFLRPSPPAPAPTLPAAPSPASSASKGKKRPSKPTGFAPSATPLLPLDAPIQSRNSALPSATSRKRKTAQAEKALAKRRKTSVSGEEATPAPAFEARAGGGKGEEEHLPADIVAAVERKRLQNTLSARKSRARKQARLQELELENEQLKARVEELERMLAMAQRG